MMEIERHASSRRVLGERRAASDGRRVVDDSMSLAFVKIDYVFSEINDKGEVVGMARLPTGAPTERCAGGAPGLSTRELDPGLLLEGNNPPRLARPAAIRR